MKKIILSLFIFVCLTVNHAYSGSVEQFFKSFYLDYLAQRQVPNSNREILDFIYGLSKNKTLALEDVLNETKSKEELEGVLILINEEYLDLIENIDFELQYTENIPLDKKQEKTFKKAHKKFMRQLKKTYKKRLR